MKGLSEYVDCCRQITYMEAKLFRKNDFALLEEYFCGEVPNDVLDSYNEGTFNFSEWILESLKSHDVESLKNKIEKEYPKNIIDIKIENKQDKTGLLLVKFDKQLTIQNSQQFSDLITFFNYVRTDNWNGYVVLEPDYPDKCNDECKKEFKNKFIHVTTKKFVDRILKSGLRCRESKPGYRKYSSRIQLKCATSERDALDFAKELKNMRINSMDPDANLWENTCVLGVDLYDVSYDIYRDHMYDDSEHCYFIKNNIPSRYIKLLYKDI